MEENNNRDILKGRLRNRRTEDSAQSNSLVRHDQERSDDQQLAHECGLCGKIYSREYKLKQHERLVHHIQIGRQCHKCMNCLLTDPVWREKENEAWNNKRLGKPYNLQLTIEPPRVIEKTYHRHQLVLSAKGQAYHQCTVCFKILDQCWSNWKHQKDHHSDTVPVKMGYQCKQCSRLYSSQKSLQKHCTQTCPILSQPAASSSEYRCEWCLRLYDNKKRYENHLKIHPASSTTTLSSVESEKP